MSWSNYQFTVSIGETSANASLGRDDTLMGKKHQDTKISLHPLSFEEAIEALSQNSKHDDSQVEESGNTKEHAPESAPSKKRTAPHRESSDG